MISYGLSNVIIKIMPEKENIVNRAEYCNIVYFLDSKVRMNINVLEWIVGNSLHDIETIDQV